MRRCRPGACCGRPDRAAGRRDTTPPTPRRSTPAEHDCSPLHAAALSAALAGWFVCALFASVAYNWTFYYLLALATAPRDYLLARVATARAERRAAASRTVAAAGAHA